MKVSDNGVKPSGIHPKIQKKPSGIHLAYGLTFF